MPADYWITEKRKFVFYEKQTDLYSLDMSIDGLTKEQANFLRSYIIEFAEKVGSGD